MIDCTAMVLVLDQGVPRDAAAGLRAGGHDCLHVGEIGMRRASDEDIIAYALAKKAIVVTLDADFHTILAVSRASGPSVIRLRLQGLGTAEVVTLVQTVLSRFAADLSGGSLVTVKARKITCHRLPIGTAD